ncbi:MAG TPA: anthranilate phosphoribosyltransferase [Acidimicrobiales bacterium]
MTGVTLEELGGWPAVLNRLTARTDLTGPEAAAAMTDILEGNAASSQIAAFIVALRMKGETVEELTGLVQSMLALAERVPLPELDGVIDIVGTGGDRSSSINVSTISAIVIAAAGGRVCKHGNRAASSACGAADLLEALGVAFDLGPAGVAHCVATAGMGFCFAPRYHPSMRHAVPTRRELGVPTVFNVLGPLANPGRVRRQVTGVADPSMAERMVQVLEANGTRHALVVYGHDGLDELTTTTTSTVHELRDGVRTTYDVDPAALGLAPATLDDLRGGDAATNARLARAILAGDKGPQRDIILLNAAAGLVAAGIVGSIVDGIAVAAGAIDDGRAAGTLDRLVAESQSAREAT